MTPIGSNLKEKKIRKNYNKNKFLIINKRNDIIIIITDIQTKS